jgi:hypothetical protein
VTQVRLGIVLPTTDGTVRRPSGSLEFRPTKRRNVGTDVVLPAPVTKGLTDPPSIAELAPTEPGWAWQVVERVQGGSPRSRYLTVPDSASVVDYADLVAVDPATLEPTEEPEAAWWAARRQRRHRPAHPEQEARPGHRRRPAVHGHRRKRLLAARHPGVDRGTARAPGAAGSRRGARAATARLHRHVRQAAARRQRGRRGRQRRGRYRHAGVAARCPHPRPRRRDRQLPAVGLRGGCLLLDDEDELPRRRRGRVLWRHRNGRRVLPLPVRALVVVVRGSDGLEPAPHDRAPPTLTGAAGLFGVSRAYVSSSANCCVRVGGVP